MTQVFSNEAEIKKWANTTELKKIGNNYVAKHFRDGLFHILTPCLGGWKDVMTAMDVTWLEQ